MKTFNEQYHMLNPQQKKAVDTIEGPVFVTAGPGTGKTQILTLRIANILAQGNGINPENILALTFTNAAAYNMRERLASIVGVQEAYRVYIATFHSFAEDMIKRYPDYFKRFTNARLLSSVEQFQVLQELTDTHGGEHFSVFKRRDNTIKSVAFAIGKIKNEGLDVEMFRQIVQDRFQERKNSDDLYYKRAYGTYQKGDIKPHELRNIEKKRDKSLALADIMEAYEQRLLEEGYYDYQDLIASVVHELRSDSLFQTELQEQFQYILVDEHQDTNDGQNSILESLIDNPVWEQKPNVFVVGDAKQSIFRFAGASQESFHTLFGELKEVTTINLEDNYRSQQTILHHAQELIEHSSYHSEEPKLQAYFDHKGSVEYREFHNYKTETLWVVNDIQRRIESGQDPSEIAVLFRNNADAQEIRTLLGVYRIPYRDFSKKNLLEDTDMLKLFLFLRVIHNFHDDELCAKLLFVDFLDFDLILLQKVLRKYHQQRSHESLFEMIADTSKMETIVSQEKERKKYQEFVEKVTSLKKSSMNRDFVSFFSEFIRESGFLSFVLSQADSALGLAKLETLFDEIKQEVMNRDSFDFDDFIDYLDTLREHRITMNIGVPMTSGVELMTFHGSKGLEFETVYIIRALRKRSRGSDIDLPFKDFSDGDVEDERRLMYVALTRAKKDCLISSYVYNSEGKEQTRSLHINEITSLPHIDMSQWEEENSVRFADFFGDSKNNLISLSDSDYIKERFWQSKLSVSALNNYCESPLLYFFRNLVRLPQARSPFLDFGNLIHATLEHFFEASREQNTILSQDHLMQALDQVLDSQKIYQEYADKAHKVLTEYFNHYKDDFELPLENELRVPALGFETSIGETLKLTGVIDKITQNEKGEITVWDYKTGRSYSEKDKQGKEKIKRQAVFYKLLLQHAFSGKYNPTYITFDFVQMNEKKAEFQREVFEVSQEDLDQLTMEINNLAETIDKGALLQGDLKRENKHRELAELLEIMKGPHRYEQPQLLENA